MKTNFKGRLWRILAVAISISLLLVVVPSSSATCATLANGQNTNYVSTDTAKLYAPSEGAKDLSDKYKLKWYEDPTRKITKGEFMLVQLRTMQESLKRRGMNTLSAKDVTLSFKDFDTLSKSVQEEVKILKSLGIFNGNSEDYMELGDPITRAQAAQVLYYANNKVLKMPNEYIMSKREDLWADFKDIDNHWAEDMIIEVCGLGLLSTTNALFNPNGTITLEEVLQILDNEVGPYSSIERPDIAKALSKTFKVTVDEDLLNIKSQEYMYSKYEEKMKIFGFAEQYNNKSAKSSELVTKAEALKLALTAIFNTNNITGFAQEHNEYENATWVEYAKDMGITTENINITNAIEKAKYIDVIMYFQNCKLKFLNELPIKDVQVNFKDMSNYSNDQQLALKDMVANGIIKNSPEYLKGNDYITKGQLNELVVNFAEKYNRLAMNGDILNTEPQKMPLNAILYPYTISIVDNSIYELPLFLRDSRKFFAPKDLYKIRKDNYPQIKKYSEAFFNTIVNIDYRTITEEGFTQQIKPYVLTKFDLVRVKDYVNYVKENEIVIKGNAKLQVPVIYFDGARIRARLKLTFEIKHSKTKEDILYLDAFSIAKETYQKNSYDILADYYLSRGVGNNNNVYVAVYPQYNFILEKDKCGITVVNN